MIPEVFSSKLPANAFIRCFVSEHINAYNIVEKLNQQNFS